MNRETPREKVVWTQIDQAFSETTTPSDNTANYVPTQVIAELFEIQGVGGIAYESAFGCNGYNIALFNLDDAEVTVCHLHKVKSPDYSFSQVDGPYRNKSPRSNIVVSVCVSS